MNTLAGFTLSRKSLTKMSNYFLCALLFGSCQCFTDKLPTPKQESDITSPIQNNRDNRLHSNIGDPYFPEVEYPKSVLDAHKPFFYKETDSYFDKFAPEVQKNFEIVIEKTNDVKKKEIITKQNPKENIKNIDSNHLSSEENKLIDATNLNTSLETCDMDEDYYYANITYGNDEMPALSLSIFEINNTESDGKTVQNKTGTNEFEGFEYINDNDNIQHLTDSENFSGQDFIELIEIISDLIGVVKDTVTKMITTVGPNPKEEKEETVK